MPTVVGPPRHSKDTEHWLSSPKREEFFGPLGVTNIRTFVDPDNRTRVGLVMDVPRHGCRHGCYGDSSGG